MSSVARRPRAAAPAPAGLRSSSSNAHARPVAVVSWPATSSVTSSSRSSASRHRLAVLVAREQQHREDVRALLEVGRRAAARDLLVDQLVHGARWRSSKRSHASRRCRSARRTAASGGVAARLPTGSSIARTRRLSSSWRGPSSTPKTACMITSSVSDCIDGQQRERLPHRPRVDRPVGRLAASPPRTRASARRGTTAASAGAGAGARRRRAAAPSAAPSTGPSGAFASPARSCSGGPRKTCFTTSGSKTITNLGSNSVPIVTTSP